MPYYELPPLSDDLDLNNFDTLATSSKGAQSLGPLWFIPPRYKPTRSSKVTRPLATPYAHLDSTDTRLDVISIRQARYRDRRTRTVPVQGSSSDEDSDDTAMDTSPDLYGSPCYTFSANNAPDALYTPRAFSSPVHAQQRQSHSVRPPFPSSSSRPVPHQMFPPYAYELPKPGRSYQY